MKKLKSIWFQSKALFTQVCLVIGFLTVLGYGYDTLQSSYNTSSKQLACSTTKKINPSYRDKAECSVVALLKGAKKATNAIKEAVR